MAIFHSYVSHYQKVLSCGFQPRPQSHLARSPQSLRALRLENEGDAVLRCAERQRLRPDPKAPHLTFASDPRI